MRVSATRTARIRSRKAVHTRNCAQAFMNSWLISIAQRFLAMEPIIILVSIQQVSTSIGKLGKILINYYTGAANTPEQRGSTLTASPMILAACDLLLLHLHHHLTTLATRASSA